MNKVLWLPVTACLAFGVAACGDALDEDNTAGGATNDGGQKPAITVGSSAFPENVLLAEIYAGALQSKGFKVDKKLSIGSREAIFPAMQRGELNVLPEYTGSLLSYLTKGKSDKRKAASQVSELKSILPAKLTVLEPSSAEDKDTVTCSKEIVDRHHLTSLMDLAKVSDQITMGGPPEIAKRQTFGLPGLKRVYGIEFKRFRPLDTAGPLTVSALKQGKVDCANLFSTQAAITANGFITLTDPKGIVEAEAVIPLIAKDAATPEVSTTLDAVSAKLTTDNLKALVKRVEVDKDDAASVAEDFLSEHELN